MGIFKKRKTGGFADVIRCDEPDYLIWKWHPAGVGLGEGKRETALRTNSVVRVKDGEVAVFVYKQKDGVMQDYIVGPFDENIKTKNFPVLSSIIGLWYEGDTPFQAEVFFINLAHVIQTKFVIPYFDVPDSKYPEFTVPVSVFGTLTFKIDDFRDFIKKHRLDSFDLETFKNQITDSVQRYVKDAVSNAPAENDISVLQLGSKIDLINQKAEANVAEKLKDVFAVCVNSFDIGNIDLDQSSEGYEELKQVTKDITTKVIQGKTTADIENYSENLRIQREEGQYSMHKRSQQENLAAFQVEKQAEVGVAGAQALGKMGENGAGNVSLGNGGAGFNPMTMMTGIAVGNAVGQNIASTLNGSMTASTPSAGIPPKVPTISFFLVEDGKSVGPFDLDTLKTFISTGRLNSETLVWKQGMQNWEKANQVSDFNGLFPPAVPSQK